MFPRAYSKRRVKAKQMPEFVGLEVEIAVVFFVPGVEIPPCVDKNGPSVYLAIGTNVRFLRL